MNFISPPLTNSIALPPQPVGIFGGAAAHLLFPIPGDSPAQIVQSCLQESIGIRENWSLPIRETIA